VRGYLCGFENCNVTAPPKMSENRAAKISKVLVLYMGRLWARAFRCGPSPLSIATRANKTDILKLLKTLNQALGQGALPLEHLTEAFEVWWPKLASEFEKLPAEKAQSTQGAQIAKCWMRFFNWCVVRPGVAQRQYVCYLTKICYLPNGCGP
jgi:hypothetical protein